MTENVDPRYRQLDLWNSETALRAVWESQIAALTCIGPALPALASAVEAASVRLRGGAGRLVYAGAGSSIRIAVQDGTELGPTFDWLDSRLHFLVAGGEGALRHAVEGAEDDAGAARAQVAGAGIGAGDVVIALAASGRTPFTVAALEAARVAGALGIGIACVADTPLLAAAEHPIALPTGAEVVAGSTRMKAGTVQKVALNMISTQIMVRLGHVHQGLMVNMRPQNAKLRARAIAMVSDIAGVSPEAATAALERCGWRVKPAVLVALGGSEGQAEAVLARAGGVLRDAISALCGAQG